MKRVIYTVLVNGYDRLIEPKVFPGWDYICFTDGKNLNLRAKLGLSAWKIRTFDSLGLDAFRYSRLPKILPHQYLADYDYSVYIDGNAVLLDDPAKLLYELNWPDMAVSKHPFRNYVYDEIEECIVQNKAPQAVLEQQRVAYQGDGLPPDTQLLENNFLLRHHANANISDLMDAWWLQMNTYSHRDQLSLPYVVWKQGAAIEVFDQALKKKYFRTKAHYRSPLARWRRSLEKRLAKLRS